MKKTILFLFSLLLGVTSAWADGKFYQFAPTTSIQDGHEYIFTIQDGDGGPNQFVLLLGNTSKSLVPWTYEVQHNLTPYVFSVTAINDGFYCLQGSEYYMYSNSFEGKTTTTPTEEYYKIFFSTIDAANSRFYIRRPTNNSGMSNEDIPYLVYKKGDAVGAVNGSNRSTNKNHILNQFVASTGFPQPMSLAGITATYTDNVGADNYYPGAWTIYEAIEMEPAHMSYYVNNQLIAQDEGANFTLPSPTSEFLAAVPACQKMIGWTDGTKNYAFNEMYLATSGATIRMDAILVPNVTTFDGNGHGTPNAPTIQQTSFTMPGCTANDGYEFLGWSLNSYDVLPQLLVGDAYQPQIEQTFYAIYRPTHTTIWVPMEEDILTQSKDWELDSCMLVAKGGMPAIPECYAFGYSASSVSAIGIDMLPYMHGGVIVNPPANTVFSYGSSHSLYDEEKYRCFIYNKDGARKFLHVPQFSSEDGSSHSHTKTWNTSTLSYYFSSSESSGYGGSSTTYVCVKSDNNQVILRSEIYSSGGASLPAINQLASHVAIRDTWDGSIRARASAFNVYVPIYDVAYIDFNWNGGEEVKYSGLTPDSHPHDKGIGYVTYLPSAQKAGYYFIGWQDDKGNNYAAGARYPTTGYVTGDDATLTAMFRPVEMDYAPAAISELALGNKVALVIEDGDGGSNSYAIKMNDKVVTMIPVTTIDALPEECWFTIGYKSDNDVLSFRSNLGYNLRCPEGVTPLTLIGSKEAQNFDTLWHTELSTAESKAYKLYSSLINNYGHRLQFKDGSWYISATKADDLDQYSSHTSLANTHNAAVWKIYKQTVSYPTQDHYIKASYEEELTTIEGKRQIMLVNDNKPVSSTGTLTCSAADLQMEDGMIVNPQTQYIEQVVAGTANLSNYSGSTIGVTGAQWIAGAAVPGQLGWQDDQAYLTSNDQYAAIQSNGTLQQSDTKSLFHVYSRAYKVTFDASSATEHGTRIVDVRYVLHGNEIALDDFPEIEAQDGRRVVGWSIVKGSSIVLTKGQVITSDTTFYAVYCPENQAIVDYDLQGRAELIERHFGNDTYKLPTPTKVKKQWTFEGWYDAPEGGTKIGNAGADYTPTGDITLYAHYLPNYTVTLRNGLTVLEQISIAEGSTYTFPNISAYPSATTLDSDKPNFRGWIKQPKAGEQATMAGMRAAGEQTQIISGDSVYQAVWGNSGWKRITSAKEMIEGDEYVLGYYANNVMYTATISTGKANPTTQTLSTTLDAGNSIANLDEKTTILIPQITSEHWEIKGKKEDNTLTNHLYLESGYLYFKSASTKNYLWNVIEITSGCALQAANYGTDIIEFSNLKFNATSAESSQTPALLYHNAQAYLALPKCDVHFFVDDEEVEDFKQIVGAGTKITLPTPEDKPGYGFRGWFDEEGNRVGDAGDQYTPTTAPINLTAEYGRHITVTLKNGLDEVHSYNELGGNSFTFPSSTGLTSPHPSYPNLVGWAETDKVGVQYEMDNLIPDQSTITLTDHNVTYQAIWGYNQWEKLTDISQLEANVQYVMGAYVSSIMYTVGDTTAGNAPARVSYSPDGGNAITALAPNTAIFTAQVSSNSASNWNFVANNRYLYSNNTSNFYLSNALNGYYTDWFLTDLKLRIGNSSTSYRYYAKYNSLNFSMTSSTTAPTNPIYLYRKHLEVVAFNQCQVHLEAGEGTLTTTDILCTAEQPNTLPQPTPDANDQAFKGWYDAPQNGHLVCAAGDTYVPTAPTVTLYAQYGKKVIVTLYNGDTKIDDFPAAVGMPFFFPSATTLATTYPTLFKTLNSTYPDFQGWTTSRMAGDQLEVSNLIPNNGKTSPITTNMSYHAVWGYDYWTKVTSSNDIHYGNQCVIGAYYNNTTMYTLGYGETETFGIPVVSQSIDNGNVIVSLGANTAICRVDNNTSNSGYYYLMSTLDGTTDKCLYAGSSYTYFKEPTTNTYTRWKIDTDGKLLGGYDDTGLYYNHSDNSFRRGKNTEPKAYIYRRDHGQLIYDKAAIYLVPGDSSSTDPQLISNVDAFAGVDLPDPTSSVDGYGFKGWKNSKGELVCGLNQKYFPVTCLDTLYAAFYPLRTVTVKNGEETLYTRQVVDGENFTFTPKSKLDNFTSIDATKYPTFYGWAATEVIGPQDEFADMLADSSTVVITEDITYQAIWGTEYWKRVPYVAQDNPELVIGDQYVIGVYYTTNNTMYTAAPIYNSSTTGKTASAYVSTSYDQGATISRLGSGTVIFTLSQPTSGKWEFNADNNKLYCNKTSNFCLYNSNSSYSYWNLIDNGSGEAILKGNYSTVLYPYFTGTAFAALNSSGASSVRVYHRKDSLAAFTKSTIHYIIGETETTEVVNAGEATTLKEIPIELIPEGSAFKGWYTAAEEGELVGKQGASFTPTTKDVYLYAQFGTRRTVTLMNGNTVVHTYFIVDGEEFVFPSNDDLHMTSLNPTTHPDLYGWAITDIIGPQTSMDSVIFAGDTLPAVTKDLTYQAIWGYDYWQIVPSSGSITDGEEYVLGANMGSNQVNTVAFPKTTDKAPLVMSTANDNGTIIYSLGDGTSIVEYESANSYLKTKDGYLQYNLSGPKLYVTPGSAKGYAFTIYSKNNYKCLGTASTYFYNSAGFVSAASSVSSYIYFYRHVHSFLALTSYLVKFNAGDGTVSPTQQELQVGQRITLPTPTAPTGMAFKGWYTAADGGDLIGVAGQQMSFQRSTTLYAQYGTPVTVTLQNGDNEVAQYTVGQGGYVYLPKADDITPELETPFTPFETLVGWTTASLRGAQTIAPDMEQVGTLVQVTTDVTYHAVWGYEWVRLDEPTNLQNGDVVVFGTYTNGQLYTSGEQNGNLLRAYTASSINDGEIITVLHPKTNQYTVEKKSNNSYAFQRNGLYLSAYKYFDQYNHNAYLAAERGYDNNNAQWTVEKKDGQIQMYAYYSYIANTSQFTGYLSMALNSSKDRFEAKNFTSGTAVTDAAAIYVHKPLYKIMEALPILVLNETTTTMADITDAAAETSVEVHMTRNLVGGAYNTFCVPFSMNADEVAEVLACELYQPYTVSSEDGITTIYFEETDAIEAGVPYLIRPDDDINTEIIFDDKAITATPQTVDLGTFEFRGVFVQTEIEATDNLILSTGDLLYRLIRDGNIKGMRAYFHQKTPSAAPIRYMIGRPHGITTDWNQVNGEDQLTKFIHNGQLIIRKNGKLYNALGTRK